jgi:hypothetical protein
MALTVRNAKYSTSASRALPGRRMSFSRSWRQQRSACAPLARCLLVPLISNRPYSRTAAISSFSSARRWRGRWPVGNMPFWSTATIALEHWRMLLEASVEIDAPSGITNGSGRYGYVIYFKEEDHERGSRALRGCKGTSRKHPRWRHLSLAPPCLGGRHRTRSLAAFEMIG